MGGENQDSGRASKEVTVVVNLKIKPGCEEDYDEWLGRFLILERKVPGYLGTTTIMETGTDSSARHIIHRFRDKASLEAWENSEELRKLIEEVNKYSTPYSQKATGLETWFTLPDLKAIVPPPKWKMAIVAFIGAYCISLPASFILRTYLGQQPLLFNLFDVIESTNNDKHNFKKNVDVYESIYALDNEYLTASYIHEIIPIELTDDISKPDFEVIDSVIDTKMRLANDKPVYKHHNDINITNKSVFSLLMKDGFAPLQRTFDEQNSDIALVNLSLSSYGLMLSTGLIADSDFRFTITTALNIAKNKEKVVIFYTLPQGSINGTPGPFLGMLCSKIIESAFLLRATKYLSMQYSSKN